MIRATLIAVGVLFWFVVGTLFVLAAVLIGLLLWGRWHGARY